jgi:hypothetical protein
MALGTHFSHPPARTRVCGRVKPAGVVCDDDRVIFFSGQALSAGMVSIELTSSLPVVVSGTAVTRERARTSRPR